MGPQFLALLWDDGGLHNPFIGPAISWGGVGKIGGVPWDFHDFRFSSNFGISLGAPKYTDLFHSFFWPPKI